MSLYPSPKQAKDAASDLEYKITKAKGTVEISELPTVDADAALLRQLFQNIIGNSIKCRKESEPPVVKIYGKISDGLTPQNPNGFSESEPAFTCAFQTSS
jgi:light-regulated signal transduction histidine kinase (bacteriophytochrome)